MHGVSYGIYPIKVPNAGFQRQLEWSLEYFKPRTRIPRFKTLSLYGIMSEFTSYSDVYDKKGFIDPLSCIGQIGFFEALGPTPNFLEEEDFHIATAAAKRIIFRSHQATYLSQKVKGQDIHTRLGNLAPDIAKHFTVKDNPIENMTFRLWAQRETEDMREDAYVALSYCWGSVQHPPPEGVKYSLSVSPLMFAALAAERQWRTTGIWIDQLCIDQKNNVEKGVSIAAMDSVYRHAQCVVIALLDIEVALAHQNFLQDFIKVYESSAGPGLGPHLRETPPFFEKNPILKQFFYSVLSSRYFTRAWCAHEMELGTNFVFYIPCKSRLGGEFKKMLAITGTFFGYMLNLSSEVPGEHGDLRDKLIRKFGLRTRIAEYLSGKKTNPVKTDVLIQPYTAQIRETPTWHDLGSGGERRDYVPLMSSKLASFIHIDPNPEQEWIKLDVLALGQMRPPSEQYRQFASVLIQKGIEIGLGRAPPGPSGNIGAEYTGKTDTESRLMLMTADSSSSWGVGPMFQYWQTRDLFGKSRERFNWTVACILECGMSWMLGTARKCGFASIDNLEPKLRKYFHSDHFEGIQDLGWAKTEEGREAMNAIFSIANWAMIWGATESFAKKVDNMPMLFKHGQNGNAMVFLPGHALLQVVVPCPLLSDEYGRFYRVWLLEAKDDPFYEKMMRGEEAEWFLQDKAILFTDVDAKHTIVLPGSLRDGLGGWRLREGVKVHGPP
ncbi:Heterokaryon incompatibility protein [Rutstroemia sp. NJR-2017a BVV2]|nr:Heterokaryon incompatibility protein [Rutstroemia sp. NJR-2017a BVV2]